jgi:hypothetical protein
MTFIIEEIKVVYGAELPAVIGRASADQSWIVLPA